MTIKVMVAPGHGLKPNGMFDPGSVNKLENLEEHDLNVKVAVKVCSALQMVGVGVLLETGVGGKKAHDPNWVGTLRSIDRSTLLLGIEIHHDMAAAPNKGFAILPRYKASSLYRLAAHLKDAYNVKGLTTKPSYADRRGLGFLRSRRTNTIIWECGNVTGLSVALAEQRGQAIAEGIHRWIHAEKIHEARDT